MAFGSLPFLTCKNSIPKQKHAKEKMPCKLTMPMQGSCKAFCSQDLMERKTLTCKHNKNANPRFQQTGGNPLLAHGLDTSVCKDQYAKMDCLWNKDRQHKENKGNKGTNRGYLGDCRASKKQELGEQNLELGDQKVGLLFRVRFCRASAGVFRSLKQACPSSFDEQEMNQQKQTRNSKPTFWSPNSKFCSPSSCFLLARQSPR